jgi:outer membrane receptor protein involved in Fe transport
MAQNDRIEIIGVIADEASKDPIPFATVIVKEVGSENQITGTNTDAQGKFKIVSTKSEVYLEVSSVGFATLTVKDLKIENGVANAGNIYLKEDSQVLDEVEIRVEKSTTEFKLDKRVFNVGQDLSSTGMGALELLDNVPSVNVSIEGQISLRGSTGVQILIDGKPSIMADDPSNSLSTITAEMVDKIEVITNPSAKYDAEGTAGIINIVMRKDEKEGLNGSVTLNTGSPDNHSIGTSLNRRSQKFNLFTQLGIGYRSLPRHNKNSNQDLISGTTVESKGTEYRNEDVYNIILGTDYHINENNVLTLSGSFTYEVEEQPSRTDFDYFGESGSLDSQWYRKETTDATNPKYQYELQYKREYDDHKDHMLLFSALGRFFGKDQASEFEVTPTLGTIDSEDQQTETEFQEANYTFKLDYTKPYSEQVTMEVGSQYVFNDVGNDYEVRDLINGAWVTDPNLTNNFEYDQEVFGVYGTGAYEDDVWGIKLGIRLENTNLNTLLTNTGEDNTQKYTDFFPSGHVSYKLSESVSLQGGYSRRIFRPSMWVLNPFFNIRNDFNIRVRNPKLKPQYSDSYEFSTIFILDKLSLNTSIYHRYTTDIVERVTYFENNISTTRPENFGTNNTTGVEFNAKYSISKAFSLMGDFNLNHFKRKGEFEDQLFDFNGERWETDLTGKLKLPKDYEIELSGNFESSFRTLQSDIPSEASVDFGIRKKIAKGKLVANLSVRDIFDSRSYESVTQEPEYYLYRISKSGRYFTFGLSYGFGKGEAMTYSSGRRRR